MKYNDVNDYEILYLISDIQDEEAVYLLHKYDYFIQKKCMKWEMVLNKLNMDMEDLQQEVTIAFLDAIKNFKEDRNTIFYTYVSKVIDAKINSLIRKMNTNKNLASLNCVSLSTIYSDRELGELIPSAENIEKRIEMQEIKDKIYEFLFELPISKACILELYFNEYSISSISKLLDEKEESVRISLRFYRKKLKNYLQQFKFSML